MVTPIIHMQTLRELISMGFSPMVALVIGGLIVLWGALCAVVVFMWRSNLSDRRDRDRLRDSWKAEVDARLKLAESKNDECDKDRDRLHDQLSEVKGRLTRFELCSAGSKCPLRLPN